MKIKKVPLFTQNIPHFTRCNIPFNQLLSELNLSSFILRARKKQGQAFSQIPVYTGSNYYIISGGSMKKFINFAMSIFIMLAICLPAFGIDVKGIVRDDHTDEPLIGVNVYVENSSIGSATDKDGYFKLTYESETEFNLVFNFIGYKGVTISIDPAVEISLLEIAMSEDIFESETIVITGIASRTSKDVAEVAVSRVTAAHYTEATSYQAVNQLIAGKVAGVQMKPSSGNVGSGFRFHVRAGGGLNGNEQPIIYIDGVRMDNAEVLGYETGGQGISLLSDINPEDIENIEILKGPAGAAMYGANGSNGVVLITTKKGRIIQGDAAKPLAIDYKYIQGLNTQSYEYNKDDFGSYKAVNKTFRDGAVEQHTLSGSGGNAYVKYFASFDQRFEEGIQRNNHMDRKSVRTNIVAFPSERISLKFNGSYSFSELSRPQNDDNIRGYLGNTILAPGGTDTYIFSDSISIEGIKDQHRNSRFLGSTQLTWEPINKLEANVSVGVDNSNWRQDQTHPQNLYYSTVTDGQRSIFIRENQQFTYDANLRYSYSILSGMEATSIIGTQVFDRHAYTSFLESEEFATELITDIGAGSKFKDKGESKLHTRDAGLFTENTFSFVNQYYMTLALRRDYASSIGKKAPNIFYPKASFAVRLDRYDFFPKMFNLMKLRMAYGESGQLPGSRNSEPLLWEAATGGYGAGAVISEIGNPELEPERIKEIELGFETELFSDYSAEFTYYKMDAENSIVFREESPSTGLTASGVPYNIGALDGWGIESMLQATPIRTRNFQLGFSAIYNYQTNEVTDLGDVQPIYGDYGINVIKEGLSKHEFFDQKVKGALFDNDGNYDGVDVTDERESLGNPIPNHTGSFTMNFRFLKNFKFYLLSDWATGHSIYNFTKRYAVIFGNCPERDKYEQQMEDNEVGTDAYIKAAHNYAKLSSSYRSGFIEKADYFKLRELSLSYSFKDLLSRFPSHYMVQDMLVGFSARNIFTATKYSGADVEINVDGSRSNSRGVDFFTLQNPRVYTFWLKLAI